MTDREVMQQALEALEEMKAEFRALDLPYGSEAYTKANNSTHVLRVAIEQAQKPVAWVYLEGLEAFKSGRPWTAYGNNGDGRIPLYLNDAVAPKAEPRSRGSGAGFESLPASPNQPEKNNG